MIYFRIFENLNDLISKSPKSNGIHSKLITMEMKSSFSKGSESFKNNFLKSSIEF